jgi:hypothetical protein
MTTIRDRGMRTLELLARADAPLPDSTPAAGDTAVMTRPAGLLTTEIVSQAGEFVDQRTLTWFGGVLRESEKRGWVVRNGKTAGGYQQGQIQRWKITAAGRQHLLDVKARRAARTQKDKMQEEMIRTRQRALKQARRTYDKATASREEREQVTILLRDAGAGLAEVSQVTGYTRQTAVNDYKSGKRRWPGAISPRGKVYPFSPKSPRFDKISQVLADETGLEPWQTAGLLKVMHSLGMRVEVPGGFRFRDKIDDQIDEYEDEVAEECDEC